jgi:hypothetical protein
VALTYAQLEGVWIAAGGDPSAASTMAAIAYPESGANPGSVQQGQPYSTTGWGLWQITPGNSIPAAGIDNALLNPLNNAKAAVAKYNAAKKRGNGFSPWTTYTSGKYLRYVQNGVAPTTAGVLDATGNVLPNISGVPTTGGAAGGATQAVSVDPNTCALGFGLPVVGYTCIFTKVEVRALSGGIMLLAGGAMIVVGVVLLVGSFPAAPAIPQGPVVKPAVAAVEKATPEPAPAPAPAAATRPVYASSQRQGGARAAGRKAIPAASLASKLSQKTSVKSAAITTV